MSSDLTITDKQDGFTPNQVAALEQMGVKNASKGDLAVFFHQVQRTGLDPFARQIYMIGRKEWSRDESGNGGYRIRQNIQVGIDGFRLIARRAAERSHETFGEPSTQWCGGDGVWRDVWLDTVNPPLAAKVEVQRGSGTFTGVATLHEYMGTKKVQGPDNQWHSEPNKMWKEKPAIMLAKCAEALALRKAFPQDLSGLYTTDEMQDEGQEPQQEQPVQAVVMSTKEQQDRIADLMRQAGVHNTAQAQVAFKALTGKDLSLPDQLTHDDAAMLLDAPDMVVSRTREALQGKAGGPGVEAGGAR